MILEPVFLPKKEFMLQALHLAEEAAQSGEVPVGAVVVKDGRVIWEGRTRREAGIINSHIDRVIYGVDDERAGCCGTAMDLFALPYSHRPEVYRGFYEGEAKKLLQDFFRKLRK